MASKTKLEDMDLTRDEMKRLGDALKDEKFRKMLMEYAEEISDPENRRRYEEEIAQMENERGMDVTFITPEPGYVLKTSVNGDRKAFINISKSDKLDKPNAERKRNPDGKSGLMWHIPHSFAPPREDVDKEKNRCNVYDFVIHPDTYRMAETNVRFRQMVEDTAMDGIEKQFQVTLDRKNVKRPKLTFKGTPTATVIRHKSDSGPKPASDASGVLKDMPYPYDNKTTEEKMKEREKEQAKKKEKSTGTKKTSQENEDGATIPKYTIVHRSEVDMQEYRNAPDAKTSTRPRQLVIKIELPLLKAASQANLDIFEKRLLLESKAPAVYKLDIALPYPVDDSEGSAKFDKQKRTLTVTLPVIPEKSPALPFTNGAPNENGDVVTERPLIEVLSNGTTENGQTPLENGLSGGSDDSTNNASPGEKVFSPTVSYTLPDFSFTQDPETVSFVLNVNNVSEDSIRRISPSVNEMRLTCTSQGEGGFPLHFSLFLRFAENCQVAKEHCSVDVTDDNVVLLLLKERSCRGLWDRFWVGLDADHLEERLFLTASNLQQQLAELDEAAGAAEQMTTPHDASAAGAADPPCDLEVTAMNEKKLTIKIAPRKFGGSKQEEEDDEYDPPSSADIEVVHTHPSPNLHGILKQRTISESSEDVNPDPESPRSPEDEDDLSSSFNSGMKRRSVSFSKHIDKATFKSSASVNSMKTALKSKRRRQRKWEERTEKQSSRRRHNSTGSEGSGDDHSHNLSDSHSHSEDEEKSQGHQGDGEKGQDRPGDGEKGQGDQGETSEAVLAKKATGLDFRTKQAEEKSYDKTQPNTSQAATTDPSNKPGNINGSEVLKDSTHKAAEDSSPALAEGSNDDVSQQSSQDKEQSIAAKIKSKLAEPTPEDRPDDSDDENDGKSEETPNSGQEVREASTAAYNEHRTECAFGFSNDVMFDLDVE